jgi:hypothetical protein
VPCSSARLPWRLAAAIPRPLLPSPALGSLRAVRLAICTAAECGEQRCRRHAGPWTGARLQRRRTSGTSAGHRQRRRLSVRRHAGRRQDSLRRTTQPRQPASIAIRSARAHPPVFQAEAPLDGSRGAHVTTEGTPGASTVPTLSSLGPDFLASCPLSVLSPGPQPALAAVKEAAAQRMQCSPTAARRRCHSRQPESSAERRPAASAASAMQGSSATPRTDGPAAASRIRAESCAAHWLPACVPPPPASYKTLVAHLRRRKTLASVSLSLAIGPS